ncbi:hypothetical protein KO465_02750 [Candidatus Micrarchaeota archaeon]|nr:hypothetical protein [Candidatus Micrarchaeota archaeon]
MRFYVSGRFYDREKIIEVFQYLKSRGYEIANDWTEHKNLRGEYGENMELSVKYTNEDVEGVRNCDVFVLISDKQGGTGMHTEFGIALNSLLEKNKPKIYVIGEHTSRCMFYFHPKVKRMKNLDEVLNDLD